MPYDSWRAEFGGQRDILSKFADIPAADIKGARAPNLQTAGNVTIAVSYLLLGFISNFNQFFIIFSGFSS